MCDECEFWSSCSVRDSACREILLSGDHSNMAARVSERLKGCELHILRERRRYA